MTSVARDASPPRLAVALLARALPDDDRDTILGDLTELFADRVDARRHANRLWFWIQTMGIVLGFAAPARFGAANTPPFDRRPPRRRRGPRELVGRLATSVRQAVRRLTFEWRYAAGVALILGIGIGPAAAMWSVVDRVWLQPLDYRAPARLGIVRFNLGQLQNHPGLTQSEILDLRRAPGLFAAVEAASRPSEMSLGPVDHLEPLSAMSVTPGLLPMLGVTPAAGRLLTDADAGAAVPVVLLDYGCWQQHFGADRAVVGGTILLNGSPADVAGVLPRGFILATGRGTPQAYDVYLPMKLRDNRTFWAYPTLVRLADGVSFAQAGAGLASLASALTTRYPKTYADGHLRFALSPLADDMLRDTRPALGAAMAGVLLLLLIAFANAAALVVARLKTRERDFAIRTAIGAGRGDLIAEVLTESAVLSACGAAIGGLVAAGGIAAARGLVPHTVPRWDRIGLGWDLAIDAAGLALAGLLVAGLIPVWKVSPGRPWQTLRGGSMQGGRAEGARSRLLLVGAQIALTVVLAFAAVQLVRSADRLGEVPLGFDPHVLTFRVPFDRMAFKTPAQQADLYRRVRDRLRQVPGVLSVGAISHLPLSGATLTDGYTADLSKPTGFDQSVANYHAVSPGYFRTMQIPIERGRDFADEEDATGQPVIVVDETLARAAFPHEDPLGRTLKLGWGIPDSRIVGVVGHARAIEIGREVRPQIYAPYGTFQWPPLIFTVRTAGDPMAFAGAMQAAVREIGTGRAAAGFAPLTDNVAAATSTLHSVTGLVAALAFSAGLLSAIGLYTVMAFLVHQRRRSTAIRAALGASRGQLIRQHLATSASVLALALPIGAALAAGAAPLFGALIYGVSARDASSLAAAAGLAAVAAWLGTYVPIRRAAKIDPAIVLRGD